MAAAVLSGCGGGGEAEPGADGASARVVYDHALTPFAYGDRCGFVDAKGKLAIQPAFDAAQPFLKGSNLAAVRVGQNWGLVGRDGRFAVTPQFQALRPSGDGKSFWVQVAGRWGVIDARGAFRINPRFEQYSSDFDAKGRAVVRVNGKDGVIDRKGEFVIAPAFSRIVVRNLLSGGRSVIFTDGLAVASQDGQRGGYIDEKGAWVINPQFTQSGWFGDVGLAPAATGPEGTPLFGYINRKGEFVIPPQFQQALQFGPGGLAAVKAGNSWGFIDKTGSYRINPQFSSVFPFQEAPGGAVAPAAVRGSDNNERWGLIDLKGAFRVQPQFDLVRAVDPNGRAIVRMGDQFGMIDRNGRFVVNPMYSSLEFVPDSREYRGARSVTGAGAPANTIEFVRINKDGKVLSSVRGVRCPVM